MIWTTGDTHGNWNGRLCRTVFPEQKEMTKEDYVVILGDFGIWDGSRNEECQLDLLEGRSFTTLFVDGNHENYDILDSLPVQEWHGGKVHFLRPSVIHLMRGQVYDIGGKSCFTFGGAASHDISDGILDPKDPHFREKKKALISSGRTMFRVKGVTWWEREMPSEEEYREGLRNLELAGWKTDFVFTHDIPSSAKSSLLLAGSDDRLGNYLQGIQERLDYSRWFSGHMHVNAFIGWSRELILYEQIIRIS